MIFAHHPPVGRLAALHNAGVDVFEADDLAAALAALHGFEVQHLLVEGGARVAQAFLRQGLVDRLVIFQSPITLGAGALSPFEGLGDAETNRIRGARIVRRAEFGEDVMTAYALRES
jgi:diaminohydroxyphosphoribosylaminopyrimidine deaminase/5-amino-6-(5-phosphoribosylamino)uracil reductase